MTVKDKLKCNKPTRANDGEHDWKVKACEDGKEKLIRFGDAKMPNKSKDPERRKAFRARHNCSDKKDKMTAGYWSCKKW
jgi:hypothetical protein